MVKSRFERKVLVSSDEEDEEKFSADETGTNANLDSDLFITIASNMYVSMMPILILFKNYLEKKKNGKKLGLIRLG